jgi:hypothetical protein
MQVIAIVSQKGGVGKSTLAVHLAAEVAAQGQRVLVLDLDPQGSAMEWASRRSGGDTLPSVDLRYRGDCCHAGPMYAGKQASRRCPQRGADPLSRRIALLRFVGAGAGHLAPLYCCFLRRVPATAIQLVFDGFSRTKP